MRLLKFKTFVFPLIIVMAIAAVFVGCSSNDSVENAVGNDDINSAVDDSEYLSDYLEKTLGFVMEEYALEGIEGKYSDCDMGLCVDYFNPDSTVSDYEIVSFIAEWDSLDSLTMSEYDETASYNPDWESFCRDCVCNIIMIDGKSKPLTPELCSAMTYQELKDVVGSLENPVKDDVNGYGVQFEYDNHVYYYYWSYYESGESRDPNTEKSFGVYMW